MGVFHFLIIIDTMITILKLDQKNQIRSQAISNYEMRLKRWNRKQKIICNFPVPQQKLAKRLWAKLF